jgi:hypothetical protein
MGNGGGILGSFGFTLFSYVAAAVGLYWLAWVPKGNRDKENVFGDKNSESAKKEKD